MSELDMAEVVKVKNKPGLQDSDKEKNAIQITLFTNGKTNTKSVMKASISLVVAAMLLTAVLAVPARGTKAGTLQRFPTGHEPTHPRAALLPPHHPGGMIAADLVQQFIDK
jgi:hypothetical protein